LAKIQIKNITEEDMDRLLAIQESLIKKQVRSSWKKAVTQYLESSPESCLGAFIDGKLVGFIIGSIKTIGFGLERSGWIEYLGVDPEYARQGVGKRLGRALIRHFRNQKVNSVHTNVRWDSGALLPFFKAIGFDRSQHLDLEYRL